MDGSRRSALDRCHLHITQRSHSQPSPEAAFLMWSQLDRKTGSVFLSNRAPSSYIQPWQLDRKTVCMCVKGLGQVHPSFFCLLHSRSANGCHQVVCVAGGLGWSGQRKVRPQRCVKLLAYATGTGRVVDVVCPWLGCVKPLTAVVLFWFMWGGRWEINCGTRWEFVRYNEKYKVMWGQCFYSVQVGLEWNRMLGKTQESHACLEEW